MKKLIGSAVLLGMFLAGSVLGPVVLRAQSGGPASAAIQLALRRFAFAPVFTGPLLAANGSVTAPAYSFSGDPDTGLYSGAANTLCASTGGGALFCGASNFVLSSGSALVWSTTTVSPLSGADIFMRRTAAKELTFDTDGAGAALSPVKIITTELDVGITVGGSIRWSGAGALLFNTRTQMTSSADKLMTIIDAAGATGTEINNGTPTLGTCTGGSLTSGSHNFGGEYTGNTSSSCVINFGTPNWTNTPFCIAMSEASTTHPRVSARSASSITITGGVSGEAIEYHCDGRIGT